MELTLWESLVVFIWGEFNPLRYLAYNKRVEQGMINRIAFRYASESTIKEIEKFLSLFEKDELDKK